MQDVIYHVTQYGGFLREHIPLPAWIGLGLVIAVLWYWQRLTAGIFGLAFVFYLMGAAYIVKSHPPTWDDAIPFVAFLVFGVFFAIVSVYLFLVRSSS